MAFFEPQTGQKISRFGAALGGRLPQFDVQQAAVQEKLSADRKRAMLLDNRQALRLMQGGDRAGAARLLQDRIGRVGELGGDASHSVRLLETINDPKVTDEEITKGLQSIDFRGVDAGILEALPGQDPLTARKIALAEGKLELEEKKFKREADPTIGKDVVVKASEILPNGAVIQSTSEGVRVFNANGERLHGQDVIETIEAGQKLGIRVAGDTAAAKAEADRVKQSIRISGDMFGQIGPIRQSLITIGKARQALAEGAETGAVDKFLPSIRESSIKLDNLMNQLGLEVISGATFGALSAGELRLALDTALPTGLQPEALDRWLADKSAAQQKLLAELQDDVITLSNGGTIASIIQKRKRQTPTPQAVPIPVPAPITPAISAEQMTDEQLREALGQ